MLADTVGISYGVGQNILTENLNMHHTAPSSQQCTRPHIPENHKICDMVIVPNPLYSPDLAPCDFAFFPKLKIKLKGRHFESVRHPKGIASGTQQH
jgi:hypothetical protein